MRLRSPLRWYGGKFYLLKHLLELIPEHKTYVEVFGGAAHLLFVKRPSPIEVYNDIDGRLVNFFRVLQDPEKAMRMLYMLASTPYSRQIHDEYQETLDEGDEVERAVKLFVSVRQSFGGRIDGVWGYLVSGTRRSDSEYLSGYLSAIDILPLIHYRLRRCQIENDDFRKIIKRYDAEATFFYLDPPYVLNTVKHHYPYHYMTDDEHRELVELLLNVKGKALLSGYDNEIYKKLEQNGWRYKDVERPLYATNPRKNLNNRRITQVERLWWNYDVSDSLTNISAELPLHEFAVS